MRKWVVVVLSVLVLGAAGALVAQQKYPNLPDAPAAFENDRVLAQKFDVEAGEWAGAHTHGGNQLVVIIRDTKMTYKEGETERTVSYKPGDVFWVDAVTHDHMPSAGGSFVLVTLK